MSLKIGITGGIGSGKTMVARILGILGIPVYDSDERARQLMSIDPVIRTQLIALLGPSVYLPDGLLNKSLLTHYLFSSEANARKINSIVHPRVRMDFYKWATNHENSKWVALESALLFEANMEKDVDTVWLVTAPLELRIQRAVSRDNSDPEKIQARIARQIPQEELKKRTVIRIQNDHFTPLLPQVLRELKRLTSESLRK